MLDLLDALAFIFDLLDFITHPRNWLPFFGIIGLVLMILATFAALGTAAGLFMVFIGFLATTYWISRATEKAQAENKEKLYDWGD